MAVQSFSDPPLPGSSIYGPGEIQGYGPNNDMAAPSLFGNQGYNANDTNLMGNQGWTPWQGGAPPADPNYGGGYPSTASIYGSNGDNFLTNPNFFPPGGNYSGGNTSVAGNNEWTTSPGDRRFLPNPTPSFDPVTGNVNPPDISNQNYGINGTGDTTGGGAYSTGENFFTRTNPYVGLAHGIASLLRGDAPTATPIGRLYNSLFGGPPRNDGFGAGGLTGGPSTNFADIGSPGSTDNSGGSSGGGGGGGFVGDSTTYAGGGRGLDPNFSGSPNSNSWDRANSAADISLMNRMASGGAVNNMRGVSDAGRTSFSLGGGFQGRMVGGVLQRVAGSNQFMPGMNMSGAPSPTTNPASVQAYNNWIMANNQQNPNSAFSWITPQPQGMSYGGQGG